ncbi:SpoIIIAC/SpoIIIAD family protein [Sulfobacillus harzensis]|uniref:Stage III sporulation protein AD n=1 Tax=Sulfobacillus harzensis TaxID=2729629 RepID=A0A7Y0L3E0_9FIRM|nr:SpoIIIAC/SpoIIIAD family protein [Sulfobacillus harzensis]NMP21159.1 stage III sporulation protein AD [Sulfobacillus harzensis]
MLDLLRVLGLGLMATVLVMVVKEQRQDIGVVVRLAVGVVMLLIIVPDISRVVSSFVRISELAHIPVQYLALLLKVIGIAYLTMFVAQLAQDSGEGGTALRIELAGKIAILLLAVPLVASITETVLKLIPG